MNTNTTSNGVGGGTEAGLERLASLKWWGTVIAVISGGLSILAILGGILWHLAVAQTERAQLIETVASIKRVVTQNTAGIKANSIGIAENRAALALVLKTSEENRNLLVLARGDITSLKLVQEEFGRRQQLLQASQLKFSGKLEEFGDKLTAFAETQADNTAETRSVAARIGDFETLVVDLDGRVERLEDLLLVHQHGTAAPSGSE